MSIPQLTKLPGEPCKVPNLYRTIGDYCSGYGSDDRGICIPGECVTDIESEDGTHTTREDVHMEKCQKHGELWTVITCQNMVRMK